MAKKLIHENSINTNNRKYRYSHEYIFNYYKENNYFMESIYKGSRQKDDLICPMGHKCKISFNGFKNNFNRCKECFINTKKLTNEYVFEYYKKYNYKLKNKYIGRFNDDLICPNGHNIQMLFSNFKMGYRCKLCSYENNSGTNHYNYNHQQIEVLLNQKIRLKRSFKWISLNMKSDPNYELFLENPKNYTLDHIIPISLFCKIINKYNLDRQQIKIIVNKVDNLQILTRKENRNKFNKGSSLFEATNYLINNGIPFETFLEENIV